METVSASLGWPLIATALLGAVAVILAVVALLKARSADQEIERHRNRLDRIEQASTARLGSASTRSGGRTTNSENINEAVLQVALSRALEDPNGPIARTLTDFIRRQTPAAPSKTLPQQQSRHQNLHAADVQQSSPPEPVYFGRPSPSGTWPANATTASRGAGSVFSAEIWDGHTAKVPFELIQDPNVVRRLCDRPQDFAGSALEINTPPGGRVPTRVSNSNKGYATKSPEGTWRVLKPASVTLV